MPDGSTQAERPRDDRNAVPAGTGRCRLSPSRPAEGRRARLGGRGARGTLTVPGKYLAFEDAGRRQVVRRVQREWTRIGRSLAADVRFDDATVSRRHALIVHQADGTRVLDETGR